jgi:hypothetical protein
MSFLDLPEAEIARNMKKRGMPINQIVEYTVLSIKDEVKEPVQRMEKPSA